MEFFYLVGRPPDVETFTERREVALFTDAEYREAFHSAVLVIERDEEGSSRTRRHYPARDEF